MTVHFTPLCIVHMPHKVRCQENFRHLKFCDAYNIADAAGNVIMAGVVLKADICSERNGSGLGRVLGYY